MTDYTKLNQFVVRPVHPFPSVSDIIQSIPASIACFAKLDSTHGYFQIPLDEEASKLTTSILPSGRFRYLRAPMGLSSSSNEWCRHSDRVVEGFSWCSKIVDDILIWATTPSELESRIYEVVLHVTLSRSKFQVDTSLKFAGCVVSASGVTPDPDRLSALSNFTTPTDQTSVRSFLGLCNLLAFFVPDYQHHTVSLHQLTGKGCHMKVDPSGKEAFKIIHCGSKGLTPTQQRYSTIELKCLAIVWATLKCSFYLRGLPSFTINTDHRPLHGVFQKDIFDLASPRLQRLREKIAMCSFQVCWVPGKAHFITDALSRAPLFAPEELPGLDIDTAISCLKETSQPSLSVIYAAVDDDYRQLVEDVKCNTSISRYSHFLKGSMDILSVSDNLVLLDPR